MDDATGRKIPSSTQHEVKVKKHLVGCISDTRKQTSLSVRDSSVSDPRNCLAYVHCLSAERMLRRREENAGLGAGPSAGAERWTVRVKGSKKGSARGCS